MRRPRKAHRQPPSLKRLISMSDLDEQKPSRRLWIFAGAHRARAASRRRGAGGRAFADRRRRRSLGAPAIEIGLELAVPASRGDRPAAGSGYRRVGGFAAARRAEGRGQGNRPAQGHADRSRGSRSGGDRRTSRKSRKRTSRRSRRCRLRPRPSWSRPKRRRRQAPMPFRKARARSRRHKAPGETARRVRATWQKALVAHLDKHKRYPAERASKISRDLRSLHARPAGPRALDRRSKRARAMRPSTRPRSRWSSAPTRCRRRRR